MGGVALKDHVLQDELLAADSRALFYRPFDHVPAHTCAAGLLHRGEEARIAIQFGTAQLRGHHHFFYKFTDELAFLQAGDLALCMEPLTSHRFGRCSGISDRVQRERVSAPRVTQRGHYRNAS